MFTFKAAIKHISHAFNGRGLQSKIWSLGLECPMESTAMYLRGESPEYILAAALALSQGEGA